MDEWLHCNVCVKRVLDRPATFYLTNCGHIFCEHCVKNATTSGCTICHQQCTVLELKDKIPDEVKAFFKSPDELQATAMKMLKQAEQVRRFQNDQRKRLRKSFEEKIKLEAALLQRTKQKIEQQVKEINDLKRFIQQKGNCGMSPNRNMRISSPDRSPRSSSSNSPRNMSPSHFNPRNKTPPSYGSQSQTGNRSKTSPAVNNKPSYSNRVSPDVQRHMQNVRANVSPRLQRLSKRSTPVSQSASVLGKSLGSGDAPYQSQDGVISKLASWKEMKSSKISEKGNASKRLSPSVASSHYHRNIPGFSPTVTPASTPKMSFNPPNFTPPCTPKIPFSFSTKPSPYRRL